MLEAARTTPVLDRVGDPERVTSIVTAYAPGPELIASVRSLTAQTWTNQEILLVDDGSPHGHDHLFREATELDPRVRLIRLPASTGVYAARNVALDRATGHYVTFQDADAWSHPARLAHQVAALRAEPARAGVSCQALLVAGDLTVTRAMRGPLLVRRGAGRFDEVRHGGDDEYADRLGVLALPDVLTLLRSEPPRRLSAALRSYRSAYRAWHRRPAAAACRPWPLLERRGRRAYDVLLVADWTRPDAGLGQLHALEARGLRVALLHLDDPARVRHGPADLDPATQHAINDGLAEQVDLTDDVRARLVVVRDPAVLRHPPELPSGIRATRVVLEISAAAAVAPRRCVAAARRLFTADPLWAPPGPHTRQALAARPDGLPLTSVDVPGTVSADDWRLDRRASPSLRPVAGRRCAPGEWSRLRLELPADPAIDLRLLDGGNGVPEGLRSWLIYRPDDLDLRCFLNQLDFYLPLPGDDTPADAEPAVLAALAAGCVVVLPPRYRSAFGDAAVYATTPELAGAVRTLHSLSAPLTAQRDRGRAFVRAHHSHARYADRVIALSQ